jgi:TATA-box binding protein (TBP) (component of TFIID and TFIIIB)
MYGIKYNPEVFPALFLRSKFKKNGYPTILVFRTGSFVIIGGKAMAHIKQASTFVQSFIRNEINIG